MISGKNCLNSNSKSGAPLKRYCTCAKTYKIIRNDSDIQVCRCLPPVLASVPSDMFAKSPRIACRFQVHLHSASETLVSMFLLILRYCYAVIP